MEINNEMLVNQANRLQQKRNSRNTKTQTESMDPGNSSVNNRAGNTSQTGDELRLTQNISNYLNKSGKDIDNNLRQLQGDLSGKQQMSKTIESLLNQNFGSGKEIMAVIQKDAPVLAQYLQMENQATLLQGADKAQMHQILENANIKIELSIKDIYSNIEKLMQKRNIEFENIAALGLPQTGQTNKINDMIENFRSNTNAMTSGIRSQNIENLLS